MGSHERVAFDALSRRLVHPTAPVLLTKAGPLGTHTSNWLASNQASQPSHPFKNRYRPPPEFPLASSCPGIVHHLSGTTMYAPASPHRQKNEAGEPLLPLLS
ncbi:hypothetical protein SSS_04576 [Sarcoptes scabiei]|uniref:Uncharacterized protein n=1 Tax=Sarcoptes scabiei TaxID=52283 RepID=A0A834RGT3_SARSC|nr:hypothetical protein SSS_04576 [Sarcoptes scabiei]